MKNIIFGMLLLSILVLAGCSSQTVVKYQCADGSFVDSADSCSAVECQTNCPALDCSNCPVKTETKTVEKEVVKYQCYDGSTKTKLSDCSNPENPEVEGLRKAAVREAFEEVGDLEFDEFKYVGTVDFTIPDGRSATKHFFMTSIVFLIDALSFLSLCIGICS